MIEQKKEGVLAGERASMTCPGENMNVSMLARSIIVRRNGQVIEERKASMNTVQNLDAKMVLSLMIVQKGYMAIEGQRANMVVKMRVLLVIGQREG
jgi:hypothetical protein